METNISVEAGDDDPVIAVPWIDSSGRLQYVAPRKGTAWLEQIEEAREWPEIREALLTIHAAPCVSTVKCDAWALSAEERQLDFGPVEYGFGAYFDLVHEGSNVRTTLDELRVQAEQWCRKLGQDALDGRCDFVVRPAWIHGRAGYAMTAYIFGYGALEVQARQTWGEALRRFADLVADC